MDNLSLIDNRFDVGLTNSYFLSIQLSLDGFSFCILDPIDNEYIQVFSRPINANTRPTDALKHELETNNILIYPYQKVFFSFETQNYTLIPDAIYDETNKLNYLSLSNSDKDYLEKCDAFTNKIKMADSWCVFAIPSEIVKLSKMYFPKLSYTCQAIPFIENNLLENSSIENTNVVNVNISKTFFDITVSSRTNLLLHNSFTYNSEIDIVYFILYIFEQLKLSVKKSSVNISGDIEKDSELIKKLRKYIKTVNIKDNIKQLKLSNSLKKVEIHKHTNLFNIALCV